MYRRNSLRLPAQKKEIINVAIHCNITHQKPKKMKKEINNSESHSPIQASQSLSRGVIHYAFQHQKKSRTDVIDYVFQRLAFLFLLAHLTLFTPSCATLKNNTNKETTTIQTNAECGMCKEKIEGKLNYTKGIVFAELDVPSKELTVKYKTDKITLEEIRVLISEIGYDADEVKANPESQENLPKCCQPGGMSR